MDNKGESKTRTESFEETAVSLDRKARKDNATLRHLGPPRSLLKQMENSFLTAYGAHCANGIKCPDRIQKEGKEMEGGREKRTESRW